MSTYVRVPPALRLIGEKPPEVSEKMRAADGRNFVPKNPCRCRSIGVADDAGEIFHPLRIEMNFNAGTLTDALELLDDAALRTVAAIQERRDDGEAQISASGREENCQERKKPPVLELRSWSAGETEFQGEAKGKHSAQNPDKARFR